MCYKYNAGSGKALLDFESPHSKVLKQGVCVSHSCLKSAISKPREHSMATSVLEQVEKLRKFGHRDRKISRLKDKLVK